MKEKTNRQKGITLIALIITIVVLLILAAVAISSITNEGIITMAQDITNKYNQAQLNEQSVLEGYWNFFENNGNPTEGDGNEAIQITVAEAQTKGVLSTTINTEVSDEYGNVIIVPPGFKITTDADNATEGIVIEDCTENVTQGSQFVWIPVGKIYTDTGRTESLAKTITLGRYTFSETDGAESIIQPTDQKTYKDEVGITIGSDICTEYQSTSEKEHGKARNINSFYEGTIKNGGYYIGRFEARTDNTTERESINATDGGIADGWDADYPKTTIVKTNSAYTSISQRQSVLLSQAMYNDGFGAGTFSSDLANSYAWDTAIVFLQTFDDRTNKSTPYSLVSGYTGSSGQYLGTDMDVICNVYDMAGNYREWTTEGTYIDYFECYGANMRGNSYNQSSNSSGRYAYLHNWRILVATFRPILYLGY